MSRDWEAGEPRAKDDTRSFNKHLPPKEEALEGRMRLYLARRRLDYALAAYNQWYPSCRATDSRPRIVIPATSKLVGNVYWQARAIDNDDEPRYQSPYAPRGDAVIVVWPRNEVRWREEGYRAAVVEGPMCALAAATEGFLGLALMGVRPSIEALDLTVDLLRGTISTLIADSDALPEMTKVLMHLVSQKIHCRLVEPYPYKDLAVMPRFERGAFLRA